MRGRGEGGRRGGRRGVQGRTEDPTEREEDGESCGDPSGEGLGAGEVEELGEPGGRGSANKKTAVGRSVGQLQWRTGEDTKEEKRPMYERCLDQPIDARHVNDEEDEHCDTRVEVSLLVRFEHKLDICTYPGRTTSSQSAS